MIKHIVSVSKSFFVGKTFILLIAFILFGSIVGGGFVLHSMHRASTVEICSASTGLYSNNSTSQSCARIVQHNQVHTISRTARNLQVEVKVAELLSIPRQIAPTPVPTIKPQPTKMIPTPVASTPVPTIPVPSSPGQAAVMSMIKQVFGSYAAGALQVARCESGYNPTAYNPVSIGGSHAAGVFQILYPSTWSGTSQASSSPYSAMANILAAHQIFVRDGYSWREWSCAA